jgi:hypothetical protein
VCKTSEYHEKIQKEMDHDDIREKEKEYNNIEIDNSDTLDAVNIYLIQRFFYNIKYYKQPKTVYMTVSSERNKTNRKLDDSSYLEGLYNMDNLVNKNN